MIYFSAAKNIAYTVKYFKEIGIKICDDDINTYNLQFNKHYKISLFHLRASFQYSSTHLNQDVTRTHTLRPCPLSFFFFLFHYFTKLLSSLDFLCGECLRRISSTACGSPGGIFVAAAAWAGRLVTLPSSRPSRRI